MALNRTVATERHLMPRAMSFVSVLQRKGRDGDVAFQQYSMIASVHRRGSTQSEFAAFRKRQQLGAAASERRALCCLQK
jgi:hypothetical protein